MSDTPAIWRRHLQDESLRKLQRKAESIEGLLAKHPLATAPDLQTRLQALLQKQVRGCGGCGGICI